MKKRIMSTLIAAGLAAAVPLTMAQTGTPETGVEQGRNMQRFHHGTQKFRMPGERVEARIAHLKEALKITDAQQVQWDAFAGVMRRQAAEADVRIKAHREEMAARAHKRPTAMERLERRQEHLVAASARMGELLAAGKPLYAALSPEQQQIADKILADHGHGRRGGQHRGHGRA